MKSKKVSSASQIAAISSEIAAISSKIAAISTSNEAISPQNAELAPPARGRSLRRKKIINYALLEDGRSLSESSDFDPYEFDISQFDKPPNELALFDKSESDASKIERVSPKDNDSAKLISKRRLSDSSLESAPLSALKSNKKPKKRSPVIVNP